MNKLLLLIMLSLSSFASGQIDLIKQCADQTVAGVDVSVHQPWTEWTKLKQNDHHFAFVKATEGLSVINPFLYRDFKELSSTGMIFGSYHYYIASVDPIKQAQYYLAMAGAPRLNELPPMLDLETNYGMPAQTVIKGAMAWLDLVEKLTGRIPVIYTYPRFWSALKIDKNPKVMEFFARYPLFIADYRAGCPEVPAPWKSWTFWQRGIKVAPGINGRVDDDVFNGSIQNLQEFLGQR